MTLKLAEIYNGIKIEQNEETGAYYIKSPYNGTPRVFLELNTAKDYINNYEAIESHARALARNPW